MLTQNEDDLVSIAESLITSHEGIRYDAYKDTLGKLTVGIGFCLDNTDSHELFSRYLPTVNFTSVCNGKLWLDDSQITALFKPMVLTAIKDAKAVLSNFEVHPQIVQLALVDMAYNLGRSKLLKFKKALALLESEHYQEAAAEFRNSDWYRQTKARGVNDTHLIEIAGYKDEVHDKG